MFWLISRHGVDQGGVLPLVRPRPRLRVYLTMRLGRPDGWVRSPHQPRRAPSRGYQPRCLHGNTQDLLKTSQSECRAEGYPKHFYTWMITFLYGYTKRFWKIKTLRYRSSHHILLTFLEIKKELFISVSPTFTYMYIILFYLAGESHCDVHSIESLDL